MDIHTLLNRRTSTHSPSPSPTRLSRSPSSYSVNGGDAVGRHTCEFCGSRLGPVQHCKGQGRVVTNYNRRYQNVSLLHFTSFRNKSYTHLEQVLQLQPFLLVRSTNVRGGHSRRHSLEVRYPKLAGRGDRVFRSVLPACWVHDLNDQKATHGECTLCSSLLPAMLYRGWRMCWCQESRCETSC